MLTITRQEAQALADHANKLRRMELQARVQDIRTTLHPYKPRIAVVGAGGSPLAYALRAEQERIEAQLRIFGLRVRYLA